MNDNIYYQVYVFVLCCVFGVVLAIIFDVFRIIRRLVRTGVCMTFVEDIMFWILSSLLFFAIILKLYNGEFRVFMVVGILLGAITYFGSLSKFFIHISVILVDFFSKIIKKILGFLLLPIKLLLRQLNKPMIVAVNVGRRGWCRIRSRFAFNYNVFQKFVLKRNNNEKN